MAFILNPSFFKLLETSDQLGDPLEQVTEQVAEAVRANAPEFAGHYKDGIETDRVVEGGKIAGRVIANDPTGAATVIEFGTEDTPAFAPLRRGAEQVVGELKDEK